MKVWALIRADVLCEDTGYMLGHLMGLFDEVAVSRVGKFDDDVPAPPDGVDLIVNLTVSRKQAFYDALDAVAGRLGVPVSSPPQAV